MIQANDRKECIGCEFNTVGPDDLDKQHCYMFMDYMPGCKLNKHVEVEVSPEEEILRYVITNSGCTGVSCVGQSIGYQDHGPTRNSIDCPLLNYEKHCGFGKPVDLVSNALELLNTIRMKQRKDMFDDMITILTKGDI